MKRVAIILLSIFFALGLQAQQQLPIITGGNGNFFEDKAAFWNQLQSEATGKNTQPESLYIYKEYSRWLKFWDKRIPASGLYNDYYAALDSFYAAENAANKPSADDAKFELPTWCELGPTGSNTNLASQGAHSGIGRVYKIRLHPQYGVSEIGPDGSQKKPNAIMFCCSPGGGLWKKDGNNPWVPLNNGLKQTSAADVAISYQNDQIMYLATGSPSRAYKWEIFRSGGVYKSTNGGQSWQSTGLDFKLTEEKRLSRLWIDPTDDKVVVAFGKHGGTYRTTDGGLNWTQVQDIGDYITDTWANENNPVNKQIIYAAGAEGLYRSTDAGVTWVLLTNNFVIDPNKFKNAAVGDAYTMQAFVHVEDFNDADPTNDYIFLTYGSNVTNISYPNEPYLQVSYDGGTNWAPHYKTYRPLNNSTEAPTDQHGTIIMLESKEKNLSTGNFNLLIGGYFGTHFSGYQTRSILNEFVNFIKNPTNNTLDEIEYSYHTDINDVVSPDGGKTLFIASDGGVYKSVYDANTGKYNTFHFLDGLGTAHVWDFDDSELDESLIITGTQDCAGFYTSTNGGDWNTFSAGDLYVCEMDKFDAQWAYTWSNEPYLYRTSLNGIGGGSSFYLVGVLGGAGNEFIAGAIEQDNVDKNLMYVPVLEPLGWELSTINPYSWIHTLSLKTNNQQNLGRISSIAIAKSNNNYVYFSYTSGINENGNPYRTKQLFKTTKGANSQAGDWVDITPIPATINACNPGDAMGGGITSIVVDPKNESRLWVAYTSYWQGCVPKVLYSADGGLSWESWSDGLPVLTMNKLVYEPKSNDRLYAATDVGVYVFDKALMKWFKYGDSFKAKVMDLEYNEKKEVLRVATYGRGVWETNAYCPSLIGWDFVNNPTLPDFYEAKQYINSSVSLASNTEKTTFKAGDHISLKPGFHASGSNADFKFHAFVKPFPCDYVCDPSSFNFSKPENEFKEEKEQVFKEQSEYLKLYPNPFDSKITLELWMNATEKADLYLTDVYGKQYAVPMQNTQLQKGKNVLNIDFPNLAKGIYFLQLKTEKQTYVRQIVKL